MDRKYAHTLEGAPQSEWHGLEDHLRKVAALAREFAEAFGAGDWGECAGVLHDAGKATEKFQRYIRACAEGKGVRGSAPHSIHGAQLALERHKSYGRMLAYAISGHHGGLPDWDTLKRRLGEAKELDKAKPAALCESYPAEFPFAQFGKDEAEFVISFFIRMIFSCLVDADWLDTEAFMDTKRAQDRAGAPALAKLSARFFPRLAAKCAAAPPTEVNRIRAEVLAACKAAAEEKPGFFSLTVPTGGGKTLSSLAFALRHAEKYNLRRIIYVIPYMSIIEQNADVFREFLGEDAVLEHHSSYDPDEGKPGENDLDDEGPGRSAVRRRLKLATENWDAPLVATTAVQFFESLFAAKPSRCRKLHNLARSVIILDEAQMLPQALLLPCLAAIRELALRYGASVVLCTATQPAILKREDFKDGLENVREIIPDPPALHARLQRVRVKWLGRLDDEDLIGCLKARGQVLCVVNTRGHARRLYELLMGSPGLFHLSANMTPAHRKEKIDEIRHALDNQLPCLLVSTSLIECGVDIDFPYVYRAAAGLDAIAQAGGRCDREGKLTAILGEPGGQVFVFEPGQKSDVPCGHFTITADKAAEVARQDYADILEPEAIEHYFRLLFWEAGKDLDAYNILDTLRAGYRGDFAFRKIAESFRIIKDGTRPLIVPHDEMSRRLARDLRFAKRPGAILRKLQRYTVQVYPQQWSAFLQQGAAELVLEGVAVLENKDIYSDAVGLCPEDPSFRDVLGLMV